VDSFLHKYPAFQLEDELLVEGGGRDVMWGHAYTRKRRARDGRRATEDLGAVTMQAGALAEDMAWSPGMQVRKKWQVAKRK